MDVWSNTFTMIIAQNGRATLTGPVAAMALLTQREKTSVRIAADGPYADVRLEVSLQPYVIRPGTPELDMRDTHNDFWADMLPQSGTVATQSLIEAEIRAVFVKAGLKPTEIKRVSKALFVNDSRRTTTTETAEPTKAQSTEPHLCPNAASPWLPPILDTTSNSYPSTRLKASTPLSCTTSFGAPSSPTGYTRAEWAAASAPN